MKDKRLIPRCAPRVHESKRFALLYWQCVAFIGCALFGAASNAQSWNDVAVTASAWSEPADRGVSEANGRPAVALVVDWDIAPAWFAGTQGYVSTDASAPRRTQLVSLYGGWRWAGESAPGIDVALLHHIFPGDFSVDWDYTEVRVDAHFSRDIAATLRATNDYYGIGGASVSASLSGVYEFSERIYARAVVGGVSIDDARFDSYGFVEAGGGVSAGRWNLEVLVRANNADPSPAFIDDQLDTRITAALSYRLF